MIPQFFPWLFDDRVAWEQALSDPRYAYELPIDCFMTIYCSRRSPEHYALSQSTMTMPAMPMAKPASLTHVPTANPSEVFSYAAAAPAAASAAAAKAPKKEEEGILSQDDIDALLAGL